MHACPHCGLPVEWKREGGKPQCHNPDGSDHWAICSEATWQKVVREGQRFTEKRRNETVIGYRHKGKSKIKQISGRAVVGRGYRPFSCKCDALPWELHPNCAEQQEWLKNQPIRELSGANQ